MIIKNDNKYVICCKCETITEMNSLQIINGLVVGWCPYCGASHQVLLSQLSPNFVFGRN